MDIEWNKKTLRFRDVTLEKKFWQSDTLASMRAVRWLCYLTGTVGLLEGLTRAVFLESGLSAFRVGTFIVFSLVILTGRATYWSWVQRYRHHFGFAFMSLLCACLTILPAMAPPIILTGMFGFLIVVQIYNLLLPYSHLIKHSINLLCIVACASHFYFFNNLDTEVFQLIIMQLVMAGSASSLMAFLDERHRRMGFILQLHLSREKARSDALLINTLPESIATELKDMAEGEKIAKEFSDAAVLFADIVGFTDMSSRLAPEKLVTILDDLFSRFDAVMDMHGIEKIKTIGDAYMAAAGVPIPVSDPLSRMAEAALDILATVERYRILTGINLHVRIGLHAGPVVAGVIGRKRFVYDLWGHTVNVAARLEASSGPGTIHMTAEVGKLLQAFGYEIRSMGRADLKGIGTVETCLLLPRPVRLMHAEPLARAV